MNKIVLLILIVVIAGGLFFKSDITNFIELKRCNSKGGLIDTGQNSPNAIETNKCVFPEATTDPRIRVTYPMPNQIITSPLEITGEAQGMWYFEASAPVMLTDWDGKIIAQKYIEAQGDWMTENFVPFKGTLEFEKPAYGERGTLILQKDNPSGLPEHDTAIEIPIRFE